MNVRTYSSINEIEPREWDAIVGKNQLICRHAYLRAIEEAHINDCRFYYPVIFDGTHIVAHCA